MTVQHYAALFGKPSLRSVVNSVRHNVDSAIRAQRDASARVQRGPDGDPQVVKARWAAQVALSDQRHWREYLSYYAWLLQAHPELADQPADVAVQKHGHEVPPPEARHLADPVPQQQPLAHWSERDPGSDDDAPDTWNEAHP